jgi:hypothetical protein
MNAIIRSIIRMASSSSSSLFAIVVVIVVVVVAYSVVLEIGIINVSYAQVAAKPGQNPMCDPNNPKLKFVNTTESHVCGIPKTPLAITTNSTTPTP